MTPRSAILWLLALTLAIPSAGQDFEKVAPKVPPKRKGTIEQAPPPEAAGDTQNVLVKELKGLIFIPNAAAVKAEGVTGIEGIHIEGVDVLQQPGFNEAVGEFLGAPVTLGSLNRLTRTVVIFCREHDRPLVDVVVPEQDITGGVVQVVVLEARLGQVRVEGNEWFSSDDLADYVRMDSGDSFSEDELRADLDWLNNNPFRQVDFVYTPGSQIGQSDLLLRANDRFPIRLYGGYEDTGNDLTGDERWLTGLNWGNVFGLDHQLNYQFTSDPSSKKMTAHSGSYVMPLPWRHTWTFFGSYVESQADLPPPFNLSGVSWQVSTRYTVPLPAIENYRHEAVGGFDFKQTNNNLEFGGVPVVSTNADIVQWVLGYNGTLTDDWGATAAGTMLYVSPGNWTAGNNDAAFIPLHAFSAAEYVYGRLNVERLTRLPGDFTLGQNFSYQFSNKNLLPSEQLGLGGYATVRGYDEREVNTDEGWYLRTEVRTPAISLGQALGIEGAIDEVQFLFFWDYGVGNDRTLLAGEDPHFLLSSVGPGVRYTVNPYLSFRFDYGFQLYQATAGRHNSRGHLGVVLSY